MRNHLLDPTAAGEGRTKECKGCGFQTGAANHAGEPFCASCMPEEAASSPIMEFYAALPYGLRRAFDVQTALFNSGHEVSYSDMGYTVSRGDERIPFNHCATGPLDKIIKLCIQHREELV